VTPSIVISAAVGTFYCYFDVSGDPRDLHAFPTRRSSDLPEIIEWNRTFLAEHNGPILADERTRILRGDLFDCLGAGGKVAYDAILIDIDDGPDMLITEGNARLYSPAFLARIRAALAPGGCVAYWLALPNADCGKSLNKAGLVAEELRAEIHANSKRPRHRIYIARRK